MDDDPALDTLLLPLRTGALMYPPTGALFLRARDGRPLHEPPLPELVCEQTFKPDVDALRRAGFAVSAPAPAQRYPLVMVLPPRQRDESRALLARAVGHVATGGRVMTAQHNNEGARSMEADLAQLAGPLTTLSKNKCRVCWTAPLDGAADATLAAEWSTLDAPRRIADGRFLSRPGIFAWDRIDAASTLLAQHLPANLAGRAADLGAGFGYLSAELLTRCRGITALDVYEAESRALDLARENLAALSSSASVGYHWHDVTQGLNGTYDVIVMNPPFHAGTHHDRPDIGRRFISVAAKCLRRGGQLWLVANRHLPYETILDSSFGSTRIVTQQHGFKIVKAVKA
jgi:16S rRNA (guanine1207-N2)-methyltransferase